MSYNIKIYNRFEEMNLKENLLRGILSYGFEKPSPIQTKGIMPVIEGKNSIIQAHSGGGKTGTFSIACLEKMDENKKYCQILILSPTRELATQTLTVIKNLAYYMNVKICGVIGGRRIDYNEVKEAQIVVATPGRIFDLMNRKIVNVEKLNLLVLDEADQMLNSGFKEQMIYIFSYIPENTQVAIYSATLPDEILDLTKEFLDNPIKILVKKENLTLDGIRQFFVSLDSEQDKYETLCDLYQTLTINKSIIYCSSKRKVSWLEEKLTESGYPVSSIHGDLTQNERDSIMKDFRTGKTRLLITTDLLARGIDIQQVSLVINYDVPNDKESYIHRIGRTGRYGKKGYAINFIVSNYDIKVMNEIDSYYQTTIEELPANIADLIVS